MIALTIFNAGSILGMLLSLFLAITNRVPVYPLVFGAAAAALAAAAAIHSKKLTIPTVTIYFIALTTYFIINALLTGVPLPKILSYNFIRYDGNFLTSYFPLLLIPFLSTITVSQKTSQFIQKMLQLILWGIVFISTGLLILYKLGHPIGYFEPGIYFFLFKTHNAAGGFYQFITIILFIYTVHASLNKSRPLNLLALALSFIILLTTGSRGSIFAVAATIVLFLLNHIRPINKYKTISTKFFVGAIILMNILLIVYGYLGWLDLAKPINSYFKEKALPSWFNLADDGTIQRLGNIADRLFYLWPRATEFIIKSPLLGIGFSRYNDIPYLLKKIGPFIIFNTTPFITFDFAHAHHTFLHVWAETGVLGLTLLLIFLKALFKFIDRLPSPGRESSKYALWTLIFASLTEHRLFAAAGALPLMIWISIWALLQK